MLMWRSRLRYRRALTGPGSVVCQITRHDTVYRLTVRVNGVTTVDEVYASVTAAATRAEQLRQIRRIDVCDNGPTAEADPN
jgi:hypothetical protein